MQSPIFIKASTSSGIGSFSARALLKCRIPLFKQDTIHTVHATSFHLRFSMLNLYFPVSVQLCSGWSFRIQRTPSFVWLKAQWVWVVSQHISGSICLRQHSQLVNSLWIGQSDVKNSWRCLNSFDVQCHVQRLMNSTKGMLHLMDDGVEDSAALNSLVVFGAHHCFRP